MLYRLLTSFWVNSGSLCLLRNFICAYLPHISSWTYRIFRHVSIQLGGFSRYLYVVDFLFNSVVIKQYTLYDLDCYIFTEICLMAHNICYGKYYICIQKRIVYFAVFEWRVLLMLVRSRWLIVVFRCLCPCWFLSVIERGDWNLWLYLWISLLAVTTVFHLYFKALL